MSESAVPVRSQPVIEGEYFVVSPRQRLAWTFWSDDFPILAEIIVAVLSGAAVIWLFHAV